MTQPLAWMAAWNYGSFIVAALFFFRTKQNPTASVMVLKISALASAFVQVWYLAHLHAEIPVWREAAAWVLFAGSFVLFTRTLLFTRSQRLSEIFSTDLPRYLFRAGPFRYVRHPFYLSYLMSYAAGLVATLSPVIAVQAFWMLALYWNASSFEEAKFAQSPLQAEYAAYRQQVGRFLPFIRL